MNVMSIKLAAISSALYFTLIKKWTKYVDSAIWCICNLQQLI